ncbi:MAG: N-acetylglucosamine-6-phosphate deacetylase [Candidatus Limnocylindrales bacterium]
MIRLLGDLFAPEERGLSVVSVDGGVVAAIEPVDAAEAVAAVRTVGGPIFGSPTSRIVPGLIDIQVNGAFGHDFADPTADVESIARSVPRFGITGFVPTIVTSAPSVYPAALANLRRVSHPGEARVLGTHVEGPFISPRQHGTHDPAYLRLPDTVEAEGWLEAGDIRWLTLAPELPGALELVRFLVDRGVRVSIGHTDATWAESAAAVDAGATMATHVFNAMRPLHHRDPGVVGHVLATSLTAGFIGDGQHLAFDTIRLLARVKAPDELVLVTDALAGLGMPAGRHVLAGREYRSDGTVGRLPDGTLSGSLLPLNLALRNLVREVGLEPAVAIRFATLNPARAIGCAEDMGRVAVGRPADIAVLGDDWSVEATLIGGAVAFDGGVAAVEAAAASRGTAELPSHSS